jgi:hypothetical protein
MRLANVKEGDPVAVYSFGQLRRDVAGRCTATQVTIGTAKYMRRTGYRVGDKPGTWSRRSPDRAYPWSQDHADRLAEREAEAMRCVAVQRLADVRWRHLTQAQADAVLAALAAAGVVV